MSNLQIYWYGVLAVYLIGLVGLTLTDDKECNVNEPECVLIALPIFSFTSWIGVLIMIANKIYEQRNK